MRCDPCPCASELENLFSLTPVVLQFTPPIDNAFFITCDSKSCGNAPYLYSSVNSTSIVPLSPFTWVTNRSISLYSASKWPFATSLFNSSASPFSVSLAVYKVYTRSLCVNVREDWVDENRCRVPPVIFSSGWLQFFLIKFAADGLIV